VKVLVKIEFNIFISLKILNNMRHTANVFPNSPILVILMMEALRSSKTPVLTRATWHNIPEDTILYSHRRENLKSYMKKMFLFNSKTTSCMHCY
jgi:hypothetical protein